MRICAVCVSYLKLIKFGWDFFVCFVFCCLAVHVVHSDAIAANVCPNMNFVIHVSDAKMAAMNQLISVMLNEFPAFSNDYIHNRDHTAHSIVHFDAGTVDADRRRLFVRVETVAVIILMNKFAMCAVSGTHNIHSLFLNI